MFENEKCVNLVTKMRHGETKYAQTQKKNTKITINVWYFAKKLVYTKN